MIDLGPLLSQTLAARVPVELASRNVFLSVASVAKCGRERGRGLPFSSPQRSLAFGNYSRPQTIPGPPVWIRKSASKLGLCGISLMIGMNFLLGGVETAVHARYADFGQPCIYVPFSARLAIMLEEWTLVSSNMKLESHLRHGYKCISLTFPDATLRESKIPFVKHPIRQDLPRILIF